MDAITLHDIVRQFRQGKTESEVRAWMRGKTVDTFKDPDLAFRIARNNDHSVVFVREDVTFEDGTYLPLLAIQGTRKYRVLTTWHKLSSKDFQEAKALMDKRNRDDGYSPAIVEQVIQSIKGGISWRK